MTKEVMFNSVFYNSNSNTIHLWETINGKLIKSKYKDYPYVYYIKSSTPTKYKNIYGNYVTKRECAKRYDVPKLNNSDLCEADIAPSIKFLHDRYDNIELKPKYDNFSVLFYDIETEFDGSLSDEYGYPINSISAYFNKSKNFYVFGNKELSEPLQKELYNQDIEINELTYYYIKDEKKMLETFIKITKKENTQAITGWNTSFFDNKQITERLKRLGSSMTFSPLNKFTAKKSGEYTFPLISDLDYLSLYKKVFMKHINLDNYKLNTIAEKTLGKGKVKYEGQLKNLSKTDWDKFIHYNIFDTLLVVEMESKLKFIEQTLIKLSESIMPYDSIYSTIADHLGMVLKLIHKDNIVLNNRNIIDHDSVDEYGNAAMTLPGGFTMATKGHHQYLCSFDFESLYPSIIRKYNIGVTTLVKNPKIFDFIRITTKKGKIELPFNTKIDIKRDNKEIKIKVQELKETDIILIGE